MSGWRDVPETRYRSNYELEQQWHWEPQEAGTSGGIGSRPVQHEWRGGQRTNDDPRAWIDAEPKEPNAPVISLSKSSLPKALQRAAETPSCSSGRGASSWHSCPDQWSREDQTFSGKAACVEMQAPTAGSAMSESRPEAPPPPPRVAQGTRLPDRPALSSPPKVPPPTPPRPPHNGTSVQPPPGLSTPERHSGTPGPPPGLSTPEKHSGTPGGAPPPGLSTSAPELSDVEKWMAGKQPQLVQQPSPPSALSQVGAYQSKRSMPAAEADSNSWYHVFTRNADPYFWNKHRGTMAPELPDGHKVAFITRELPKATDSAPTKMAVRKIVPQRDLAETPLMTRTGEGLTRGSAVSLVGLSSSGLDVEGQVGKFLGTDRYGLANIVLSKALGNAVVGVVPEAVWPLPVQTSVKMKSRPNIGTILDFIKESSSYRIRLDSGEEIMEEATALFPSRILDANLVPDASATIEKREHRCRFIDSSGEVRHFYFLTPTGGQGQERDPLRDAKWPMLLYLHGSGGGTLMQHPRRIPLSEGQHLAASRFAVVCPECLWGWKAMPHVWVAELITHLACAAWVDRSRIYATGCSMGGMGTWEYGTMMPWLFAAIAPCAAYHFEHRRQEIARKVACLPILVVQSKQDHSCKYHEEYALWKQIKANGGDPYLHDELQCSHSDMFAEAYGPKNLFEWLLSIRKDILNGC